MANQAITSRANYLTEDIEDNQLLTFADLEVGMGVIYRGDPGFITEKGPSVMPAAKDSHVRIALIDSNTHTSPITLHEAVANRFIIEKQVLWVNWNDYFSMYDTCASQNGDTE